MLKVFSRDKAGRPNPTNFFSIMIFYGSFLEALKGSS